MQDVRNQVKLLTKELGITQRELGRRIEATYGYKASPTIINYALNGLNTPKTSRVLVDGLQILMKEKARLELLVEAAKGE